MTAPVVSKIVYDAVMTATATKVETSVEQYNRACSELADCWVPACGGKEEPFTCRGYRLLYCFNPRTGQHAYIDLGTDMPLTNEEADRVFLH